MSNTDGLEELRRLVAAFPEELPSLSARGGALISAWQSERELAAADRAALERLRDTSRQFPLQDGPSVPWSCIAPHERQAQANHYQTIQRLAERGGLSCAEFWFVMNDKKWDDAQASNADKSGRALAEVIITSHDKTRRERDEARAALAQARAALSECRAALYGAREVIGNIGNIGHAIDLADAALSGGAR